jgi:hypothetical protein
LLQVLVLGQQLIMCQKHLQHAGWERCGKAGGMVGVVATLPAAWQWYPPTSA